MRREQTGYEFIVEYQVIGGSMKVTLMDPHTLLEVSIVGPANYPKQLLVRQAMKKMQYVKNKRGNRNHGAV